MVTLNKLYFTREHLWIKFEENFARIGITDFAQGSLGDLIYVELPDEGRKFCRGEEFGAVESTKNVSALYMPLSCVVIAKNGKLEDEPGLINSDPYGEGWLVCVNPYNEDEYDLLLDEKGYDLVLNQG